MDFLKIRNNSRVALKEIPELDYKEFTESILALMKEGLHRHCVNYFGYLSSGRIRLICCIADDITGEIIVSSSVVSKDSLLLSLTCQNHNFEKFEREIHENFGISYSDHPWLKPVRNPENYPFVKSNSEELHEVGVGPIHAGVIEPGHFRFICNGEQVMHLEIALGYQHRGIEELFLKKQSLLSMATMAENIAGDTVAGHTSAFANLWETVSGEETLQSLHFTRTLALELERIAIHTGDLAAICGDIAYQLGNSVYGRLRTPIINFLQQWCGNRLAKGLIRAGKTNFPFTDELARELDKILSLYESDFDEITSKFFRLPSALSRMERTGTVSHNEVAEIGTVGPSARMSGLGRDIRSSHPFNLYGSVIEHNPILKNHGDVYSRVQIRREEIKQSISYARKLIEQVPAFGIQGNVEMIPQKESFAISLTEGWRGEICHCVVTDNQGNPVIYKIKDPSHHNWMALAIAVRNNEISDFPVCNKSFNLSYCGHDL